MQNSLALFMLRLAYTYVREADAVWAIDIEWLCLSIGAGTYSHGSDEFPWADHRVRPAVG